MSFWTPETVAAARRLYMDEGLSAAETGRRIGATRSAVIGKAHRLGWAAERDPGLAAANLVRAGRATARSLRPPLGPKAWPRRSAAAISAPRRWTEREVGECAYPVAGEGEAILSCCAPSGASTYCESHAALMYAPRSEAQKAALERIAEWVDAMEAPRRPVQSSKR